MNLFAKEKQFCRQRTNFWLPKGEGENKKKRKGKKRGHLIPCELMSHEENLDWRCVRSFFLELQGETMGARPIPFLCVWPGSIFTRSRSAWHISKGPSASGLHQLTQLKSSLLNSAGVQFSVQFSSVAQSCPTLCNPMNCSTLGLPICHQLPEFTQTHVHRVGDAIQPSHPLSSPSPHAPNPSQHHSLF